MRLLPIAAADQNRRNTPSKTRRLNLERGKWAKPQLLTPCPFDNIF